MKTRRLQLRPPHFVLNRFAAANLKKSFGA
jgi:hypothetical protein